MLIYLIAEAGGFVIRFFSGRLRNDQALRV